ncbi:MAG: sigma-70 family RNA polymerase sigma factor [Alphaproteobacteria bacterium]
MPGDNKRARFEREVLPHLDAAYNLARWLMRGGADAEDAVQEACLRAYKYFDGFHGGNAKAWLLKIVRNCCLSSLAGAPREESMSPDEEGRLDPAHERALAEAGHGTRSPEALLIAKADAALLHDGLAGLPAEYREVLVMREIEELSYKDISQIAEIPLGTVMSRLARGRTLLEKRLVARLAKES